MIKINLLPEEFRKIQKPKRSFEFDIPKLGPQFLKIAFVFVSVLIGLHLLFGVSLLFKSSSLKKLNMKWQGLQPDKSDIDRLNMETAAIDKIISPLRRLIDRRISWSRELNQLSNLMTTGVWLRKLFINTEVRDAKKGEYARILNLEGSAASLYGDEAALIAKFVKALQEDKDFFQYFSDIKLGPMEKVILEKIPVMNFKIYCFFKKKV